MKQWITIAFLFFSSFSFGQTSFLKEAVSKLDRALIAKDSVTLKQILHKDLNYGHSNGWVESKQEVINDLFNGKLTYQKIESSKQDWKMGKDWATVRSVTEIRLLMNEQELLLKLHVLQVWIKTNKGWQLLARQSTKI